MRRITMQIGMHRWVLLAMLLPLLTLPHPIRAQRSLTPLLRLERGEVPALITAGLPFDVATIWQDTSDRAVFPSAVQTIPAVTSAGAAPANTTAAGSNDAAAVDGSVSPPYWDIVYQFRNTATGDVTEYVSDDALAADIFTDHSYRTENEWSLDDQTTPGRYAVRVMLRDPAGERSELVGAIGGVLPENRYDLGVVTVQQAYPVISSRESITASNDNAIPCATQRVYAARAVADTYVRQSKPSQNFASLLQLYLNAGSNRAITLLRFDVSGIDGDLVQSATLHLAIMDSSPAANIAVYQIGNDWDERRVTWRTQPALGQQIASLPIQHIQRNTTIDIPLGQAIATDGVYSFALTTDADDDIGIRSRRGSSAPTLRFALGDTSAVGLPLPETSGDRTTFTPQPIGMNGPEIVNPLRGLYRWNGQEYVPQAMPSPDAYGRYTWRDLEPTQGDYGFAKLERDIAKATREGRKYSFRVRTVVSTKGSSVPDYAMGGKGWWADYNRDGQRDTYVPDWNDPAFLRRVNTFMQALGTRYDGDPRIGFIDIGLYGNWGEWHMAGFGYPSATGAQRATVTTMQRLVDMHVAAFPATPLVMMTDPAEALVYAMGLQTAIPIGWRRDSLGWNTGHFGKIERDPVRWNAIKDRWKTALVVTEFCNPRFQEDPQVFQQAMKEVQQYHVSLVSNANTIKWQSLSAVGQQAFVQLGKMAGYRLSLEALTLPTTLAAGSGFGMTTRWSNSGVAPVYEPWVVHVQLRPVGSSSVAWDTPSAVDLTKVLPGGPATQDDTATLPETITPGDYDVVLVVRDPNGTRASLALAIGGVQADGSYRVGTINVH